MVLSSGRKKSTFPWVKSTEHSNTKIKSERQDYLEKIKKKKQVHKQNGTKGRRGCTWFIFSFSDSLTTDVPVFFSSRLSVRSNGTLHFLRCQFSLIISLKIELTPLCAIILPAIFERLKYSSGIFHQNMKKWSQHALSTLQASAKWTISCSGSSPVLSDTPVCSLSTRTSC